MIRPQRATKHDLQTPARLVFDVNRPRRLRIIGLVVLVAGLAGAGLFYRIQTRSSVPTVDELLPGYSQRRARQTGIIMGSFVVTLLGWADALEEPATQALVMAGVSTLVALACFRVAWLLDPRHDDEPRAEGPRD
jgi:hypothetical protein